MVASNDENLIGLSSEGINIIQQVKQKPANKLVRVSDRKCRYIGRMTKGRDYYVYMFIDEQMAFALFLKTCWSCYCCISLWLLPYLPSAGDQMRNC